MEVAYESDISHSDIDARRGSGKSIIVFIIFAAINALMLVYMAKRGPLGDITFTRKTSMLICSMLLFSSFPFFLGQAPKRLKINIPFTLTYIFFAAWVFISALFHQIGTGFRPFSVFLIVALIPCFYVWSSRSGDKIFLLMARAVTYTGAIYGIMSVVVETYIPGANPARFQGVLNNPNTLAAMLIGAFFCSLVLIYMEKPPVIKIISSLIAVFLFSIIALTQSRTAILAAVICIIVFFIWFLKNPGVTRKSKVWLSLILLMLCGLFFSIMLLFTDAASYFARFFRFGESVNSYSSGRIDIWKIALNNLNLFGNSPKDVSLSYNGIRLSSVHNMPLDFAYRSGAPAGIAFLGILLFSLVHLIKLLIRKGEVTASKMFASFSISAFLVYSIVEVSLMPFVFPIALCYYTSLGTIMFSDKTEQREASAIENNQE
jgi:hypothetical protein